MANYQVNTTISRLEREGVKTVLFERNPVSTDWEYPVPTIWVNTTLNTIFFLTDATEGAAIWQSFTGAGLPMIVETRAPTGADAGYTVPTGWLDTTTGFLYLDTVDDGVTATWIRALDSERGVAQEAVIDVVDGNLAPPTEVLGDRYIIVDLGGGVVHADWDGASFNDIVQFDGAAWVAHETQSGDWTAVTNLTTVYIFVLVWEQMFVYSQFPDENSTLYVGKNGSDLNDGKNNSKAFLTFGAALAAASSGDVIRCTDGGTYIENLTIPEGVKIDASGATISGYHTIADGCAVNFNKYIVPTAQTGFTLNDAGAKVVISGNLMSIEGTGIGVASVTGTTIFDVGSVTLVNGALIGALTADIVNANSKEIIITGTGSVVKAASDAKINIVVDSITETSTGTLATTASASTASIDIVASRINLTNNNIVAETVMKVVCADYVVANELGAGAPTIVSTGIVSGLSQIVTTGAPSKFTFDTLEFGYTYTDTVPDISTNNHLTNAFFECNSLINDASRVFLAKKDFSTGGPVGNNDFLGEISYGGWNGSKYVTAVGLAGYASSDFGTGSGYKGAFKIRLKSNAGYFNALSIDKDGNTSIYGSGVFGNELSVANDAVIGGTLYVSGVDSTFEGIINNRTLTLGNWDSGGEYVTSTIKIDGPNIKLQDADLVITNEGLDPYSLVVQVPIYGVSISADSATFLTSSLTDASADTYVTNGADHLSLSGTSVTTLGSSSNIDLSLVPKGTGVVKCGSSGTAGITGGQLNIDNLRLDGNAITSTNTNGSITVTPNGSGDVVLDGLKWPQADGTVDQVLKTNGSGQLAWVTPATGGISQECLAYRSTNQGTGTVIFETEVYDTGSNYNNSTGIYTVPETGKYIILVQVASTYNSPTTTLITSNRSYALKMNSGGGNAESTPINVITDAEVGDTIYVSADSGVFGSSSPYQTFISIARIK